MTKTIALVLGSGGARGHAHIGVIETLETAGYKIVSISGSSMGALIGGLYACGKLPNYKAWILALDFMDMLKLLDFSFSDAGLLKGDRVFEELSDFLGENTLIEELPIRYTAVAADLVTRKEIWFQRGSLKTAIRASIAVPLVFTPVHIGGRLLVDGGVLNPLPVAATLSEHTDLVVAVNLNAQQYVSPTISLEKDLQPSNTLQEVAKPSFKERALAFLKRQNPLEIPMFDILNRSFDTMQEALSHYKIAGYPPDIEIKIPINACNFYDFHKATDLIEMGRVATQKALEQFEGTE